MKLTKNFNFLEEQKFDSYWKDEIIKKIEQAEKLDDPNENIIKIYEAVDLVLRHYVEKYEGIDLHKNYLDFWRLCDLIKTSGKIKKSYYLNAIHNIKNTRNLIVHKNEDKQMLSLEFDELKVVSFLGDLRLIIDCLIIELNEIQKEKFNAEYYIQKLTIIGKNVKKDISAINENERKESKDNIRNDLKIDEDILKNWLSIKNAKLIIPIYQRKYEWNTTNIDILFDDIKDRMNDREEHYFGTIAQKKSIDNNISLIKIIDGQQRITTSFLFIAAARDYSLKKGFYKNKEDIDWYEEIVQNINKEKLSDYIYNPGGNAENNEHFRRILDSSEINQNKKENKYQKNYLHILDKFEKEKFDREDISVFMITFLTKFKIATINFNNDSFSNKREMDIFENLNSKGLELDLKDLIKNHFFNFCSDNLINEKEDEIARKFNNITTNTDIENDLKDFYRTISEIMLGYEISKDKREEFLEVKKAFDKFLEKWGKEEINNIEKYEKACSYLESIMHIFKDDKFNIFLESNHFIKIINNAKKEKLFFYFSFLIYEKLKNNDKKFDFDLNGDEQNFKLTKNEINSIKKLFLEITKFLIRTQIIITQGDSRIKRHLITISHKYWNENKMTIEKMCNDIINDLKEILNKDYKINDFKNILISNNKVSQKAITSLLKILELDLSGNIESKEEWIVRKNSSLEHIIPKEYTNWVKELNQDERIEFEKNHEKFLDAIGNYLILTKSNNSKAKNNDFNYKKENVYNNLISPLYRNDDNDIDISRKNKWCWQDVENRTQKLVEHIIRIFE